LPFKPNLFESALEAGVPTFPLAFQYFSTITGKRSYSPAFIGDMGLIESMANIIQNRHLGVELRFLPFIEPLIDAQFDRKLLALYTQEAIAKSLQAP